MGAVSKLRETKDCKEQILRMKFKPGPAKTFDGRDVVIFEVTESQIFGKVQGSSKFPQPFWSSTSWNADGTGTETGDGDLMPPEPERLSYMIEPDGNIPPMAKEFERRNSNKRWRVTVEVIE